MKAKWNLWKRGLRSNASPLPTPVGAKEIAQRVRKAEEAQQTGRTLNPIVLYSFGRMMRP